MDSFKDFLMKYRGAIIGLIVAILILCTRLYKLIIAIVVLFNRSMLLETTFNKINFEVKEKLKNFIDRL